MKKFKAMEEEIRFQISADHTEADLEKVLAVLAEFEGGSSG